MNNETEQNEAVAEQEDAGVTVDQPVDQSPQLQEREPRQAVVPFTAGGPLAAMIPQTPQEYARMANLLMDAGCVPASYDKGPPEAQRAKLIIGLMKSVEIGVPPITGLNGIMIVNNRPSVWGDLAVSLIQRSGNLKGHTVRKIGPEPTPGMDLKDWDDGFGYVVTFWRVGQDQPYVGEFTVGDARRSRLWLNTQKQPWINYPKDMLFNRARAKAMRAGFADALHGMGIVEEDRDHAITEKVSAASLLDDAPTVDGGELTTEQGE